MPTYKISPLKKIFKIIRVTFKLLLAFLVITAIVTTLVVYNCGDEDFKFDFNDKLVGNVTQLNSVRVGHEISPTTEQEIISAITDTSGPISIGGGRYSQGGQVAYPDSLHIDMRKFNKVLAFDKDKKQITVQTGIRWRDIQDYIDPYNLSIRIMQTYSNFTVGGSLSVNVHGRYVGEGPLIKSVDQIKIVLADGSLKTASPTENSELFYGAIGGYGGIGVIVEATLNLADNIRVERTSDVMDITEYKKFFFDNVRDNQAAVFTNGDIYPPNYERVRSVTWIKTDKSLTDEQRIRPRDAEYYWGPKIVDFMADYDAGKWMRQHILEPVYYLSTPVVWRNNEASYDVRELEPASRKETTYGLREYFVPVEKFDEFVPKMRAIFQKHEADIINVSIRHAHQDPGALLAWAKTEVFAFVVYYRQGTSREDQEKVKLWSKEMIDAAVSVNGSYYLPYQVYESRAQFAAAYPHAQDYFALKQRLDPNFRFRNQLWAKLYPDDDLQFDKDNVKQYFRGEEQTFLTIPEWYLVFNPVEYANYLTADKAPSRFPFWESISEYWRLYDRVRKVTEDIYPENSQYITMLRVIGISTTIEYMYKGLYEKTIGTFTAWTAGGELTPEDKIITQAQLAYSKLIYDEAWYKFDFFPWIKKIWADTDFFGKNFIRKLERKLFFSLEFAIKTGYAKIIGYAATSSYEQSDGFIYMTAKGAGDVQSPAKILEQKGDAYLLAVPRWGVFTAVLPDLVEQGFIFQDISGNTRIVLSYIGSGDTNGLKDAKLLFASPLVSNPQQQRVYVYAAVSNLKHAMQELKAKGFSLEHIYDY
ncbi:FAD-binding protein [Cellvibrio zantedeschiae]|nr:FAD-dependent oxidoreductase [Cellvibrio zantedeschiae]